MKTLDETADQTIRFNSNQRQEVAATRDLLLGENQLPVNQHADKLADLGAAALGKQLSGNQRRMLERFGGGEGEPYIVVDGIPVVPDLPPTPKGFHDDTSVEATDCLLLGMIRQPRLQPIAVEYENFGQMMRNVAPMASAPDAVTSHGAKQPLEFHTDNGYEFEGLANQGSPSPRFLCFAGMRNQDCNGRPVPPRTCSR